MSTPFIGEIRMFGFPRTPEGWVPCDGRLLQIAEYEPLYVLLGTTYGGDGVSTFATPDLRGRLPVHQGTGLGLTTRVPGEKGGTESVSLLEPQMPAHTHTVVMTTAAATTDAPGGTVMPGAVSGDTYYTSDIIGATPAEMNAAMGSMAGGSQPHENCMPTLVVQYCIASTGIFPQQA